MESKYVHLKGEINDDENKTILGYDLCIQNVMTQFSLSLDMIAQECFIGLPQDPLRTVFW